MLYKKVTEKYYADESINIQNNQQTFSQQQQQNNLSVNHLNGVSGLLNRNGYMMPSMGFDNAVIQKFTFDILEEINEIEEERRKKEMREREELSQLRYLELQRIIYNLQFNSNGEIDRETRYRLKNIVLNMTVDDLKNKYKADINYNMLLKSDNTQQGVYQNKYNSSSIETNNNLLNNNLLDNGLSKDDRLETLEPAGTRTLDESKVTEDNKHELTQDVECNNQDNVEIYTSSDRRLINCVDNLFNLPVENDPERFIKQCVSEAPSQVYTVENSINLDDINLDEIQVVKVKKAKDVSYTGKKKQFISIDNIIYQSLKEASEKLNLNKATILWRLKSNNEKFNNYVYVDVAESELYSSISNNDNDNESNDIVNQSKLAAAA